MSLEILILLWLFSFILYFLIKDNSYILNTLFSWFNKGKYLKSSVFKKIWSLKFFTKPWYIVKKLVRKEKYNSKLISAWEIISFEEFVWVKQFFISIWEIYFWIFIIFWDASLFSKSFFVDLFFIILIFVFFFYLPDIWLTDQIKKRESILSLDILYFVDMLAITLDAWMNIEQALIYISDNLNSDLTKEIWKKMHWLKYWMSFEEILDILYKFIPIDEFQRVISTIKMTKKLWVSLSKTLTTQSQIIRTKKLQRAEEISRTASVKISVPLVLFIFPALLIIYLGPAIIKFM